jgi:AAA15 family ATPase/GTPase
MLTRIEIDGFKTFEGFGLDLGPMQVILGPNASGKSNLFDAIRLLSNLAGSDLRSSVRDLRGEPVELFRIQADGSRSTRMTFAVELYHVRIIAYDRSRECNYEICRNGSV